MDGARRVSSERLSIDVVDAGRGACRVVLEGEIDIASAPALRQVFIDLISEGCADIAVDARHLEFVDSTGIGVLIGCSKRLKTMDGTFTMVQVSDRIRQTFDIVGVSSLLCSGEGPPT